MATKKKKKTEPANEPTPQDPPADKNPKRLKQSEIPGTERPRIREIDDAAEAYVAVRNERQELTKQEVAKKKILSDLMHKHADAIGRDEVGGVTYRYDGDMLVILKPAGEELKVKHVDPDDPEPEPKPIVVGTAPADITEGQT